MFKKIGYVAGVVLSVVGPCLASSGDVLDLTATGSTLAGYVTGAAAAALGILAAILGVRVIIRAFKTVIGR